MRYAVLSDIHSNLEALKEAVAHIRKEGITRCYVLGDMIGYGANPNECLEEISKLDAKTVAGNHDKAVYDDDLAAYFSHHAHEALLWTQKELDPKWHDFLTGLPLLHTGETCTCAHGSIDSPESFQYLFYFSDAEPSFERLKTKIGWIGHTHVPQIFNRNERRAEYHKEGKFQVRGSGEYLINPGSVGQPRDHDPRLSFALFDDEALEGEIVRLTYDNKKAADKIRAAGLPPFLADRLL